jgi:hypothetical protein
VKTGGWEGTKTCSMACPMLIRNWRVIQWHRGNFLYIICFCFVSMCLTVVLSTQVVGIF